MDIIPLPSLTSMKNREITNEKFSFKITSHRDEMRFKFLARVFRFAKSKYLREEFIACMEWLDIYETRWASFMNWNICSNMEVRQFSLNSSIIIIFYNKKRYQIYHALNLSLNVKCLNNSTGQNECANLRWKLKWHLRVEKEERLNSKRNDKI